ncbi:MAG TPA: Gfo/Idh/MocA family oxidoreductase [Acidimicrobiia bacterium]|nr:Gfo/Idh/MocA family oxidoreductase [Acidimicrobiia bacterium]
MTGWVPTDRPTRVGVLGLGRIFDLTTLGYRDNPDVEVVALCDLDARKVEQRLADWPDAHGFTDVDRFLAADCDVVEVLVPTPAHCEVVCQVLRAGHHVTVQKPMASSLAEADAMIAARDAAGVQLRVMENYLFYEPLLRLRDIVASGEIGDVAGFSMKMVGTGKGGWDVPASTWIWQIEQGRDGRGIFMFDDGWHKFAVARWLFGEVADVMAWVGQTEVAPGFAMDAPSTVMWNHTNGVRGVYDLTLAPDMLMASDYYSNDERFEVTGTKGFVRVNHCTAHGLAQPVLEVYADGELRQYHALDDDWGSSFRESTRHFITKLRAGEEYTFTAEAAREVLAFVLGAIDSSAQNRPLTLR